MIRPHACGPARRHLRQGKGLLQCPLQLLGLSLQLSLPGLLPASQISCLLVQLPDLLFQQPLLLPLPQEALLQLLQPFPVLPCPLKLCPSLLPFCLYMARGLLQLLPPATLRRRKKSQSRKEPIKLSLPFIHLPSGGVPPLSGLLQSLSQLFLLFLPGPDQRFQLLSPPAFLAGLFQSRLQTLKLLPQCLPLSCRLLPEKLQHFLPSCRLLTEKFQRFLPSYRLLP